MTPDEERWPGTNLSRDARRLHERSRQASWTGASIWLRFRALKGEETDARLKRRSDPPDGQTLARPCRSSGRRF